MIGMLVFDVWRGEGSTEGDPRCSGRGGRAGWIAAQILLVVLAEFSATAQDFGSAVALNSNAASDSGFDAWPQVTIDDAGNWVAVWASDDSLGGTIGTDRDILVARSTDNGASWTAPAALNGNAGSDLGKDSFPQVTTDGTENWVAVWMSREDLGGAIGTDRDILVARSTNSGASWTAPTALNSNAGSDSQDDRMPQVAADGFGNWVAVWASSDSLGETIGSDSDILVARSRDNGASWTAPAPLNSNAAIDSGDDTLPQVNIDGFGNWVAVWASSDSLGETIGSDSDILVARSGDNGASWTAPAPLNSNAASDTGHDGSPHVTTDRAGNWVAVWASSDSLGETIGSDSDIVVARSRDNGASWTAPAPLNSNAAIDSGDDMLPQVTIDGFGNWIAVWDSRDSLGGTIGGDRDILVARSRDNGASWTAPVFLNSNATNDSAADSFPQVTTDGARICVVVWQSRSTQSGTIGSDADILLATDLGYSAQSPRSSPAPDRDDSPISGTPERGAADVGGTSERLGESWWEMHRKRNP